ncbi:MAG TPA: metalloregulator ArsR/SmtB family transcription factor [Kofleriaceae bacterium]|nr:metalloregulator ArsR/SmtB family transcription factor [Kofleriaceae bacterium]
MLSSASNLDDVRPLTRAFRALGDETRVRIVALLAHGELCVCHLESALGISQPNCSRQLGILKAAGIVDSRRDGTWVYYRISDQQHDSVKAVLDVLVETFGAARALRADHARLQRSCGPNACK